MDDGALGQEKRLIAGIHFPGRDPCGDRGALGNAPEGDGLKGFMEGMKNAVPGESQATAPKSKI